MLTVHHLDNSRSHRIVWLLEELGVPYEIKCYKRDSETMLAPPEMRQIHPLGKAPIVTDSGEGGDGELITVAESGAIIEYLADTYGASLKPAAGTEARRRYTYWLHYAEGSLMPPLLLKLVFNRVREAPVPFFLKPVTKGIASKVADAFIHPQITLHLGFVEQQLKEHTWFAGDDFSAADIQMSFPLEGAFARGGKKEDYPTIAAFLARIHQRPAYQRAIDKGGPLELLM